MIIREIQKETRGFTEFVLLPFMRENNELGKVSKGLSFKEIALTHAISRILLHPLIKNIQTSWVKLGVENALKMLFCGANDFGGTLMEENISRAAGGKAGEYLPKEKIENLIRSVGRIPRQRDTLYNLL
jgi:FO synthase subunit 2